VRWEKDENLGRGKFGVVFAAREEGGDDEWAYALKRLQGEWLSVDEARKRFKRETDIQSSLEHENVIPHSRARSAMPEEGLEPPTRGL
jgi:serine/threonine protein kinase